MEAQRRRARAAAQGGGADLERAATFAREAGFTSEFVGYEQLDVETTADAVEELGDGRLLVKLRASPFYAEGGGQVSDHGSIESDGGRAAVEQVLRFDGDQALVAVLEHGTLQRGAPVRAPGRPRPARADDGQSHRDAPPAPRAAARAGRPRAPARIVGAAGQAALRLLARRRR